VTLSASSDRSFQRLCEALDLPGLPQDPRFATNRDRVTNVEALDAALQGAISGFDRAALIERLEAADAVVGPVNSVADILSDPHIRARGNVSRSMTSSSVPCGCRRRPASSRARRKLSAAPARQSASIRARS
jgi:crotonobetainyl-CoA:carnitine CoA-transferase CaiB-like acyl-CoA transferase